MSEITKSFREDTFVADYPVRPQEEGMRLDQFVQIYRPTFSREELKRRINEGHIKIEGRPGTQKPSTKVHEGDHVSITVTKATHEDEYWLGEQLELQMDPEIIHEDENLIVINKPPFMTTHPAGRHLFNCATVIFEKRHGHTIHSIHRIDRETSGVLLLGKNPKIANRMTDLFINDQVKKCYFFISVIDQNVYKGNDSFIAHERLDSPDEGAKRVIVKDYPKDASEGKSACTHFEIVTTKDKYAIGLAFPQTGRQHQIRVHAKVHGLPLLGDKLYLGGYPMFQRFKDQVATREDHDQMELSRHALHAMALHLPYKDEQITFFAHIPLDFKKWITTRLHLSIDELESKIQDIVKRKIG